jgi:peptidoglycan L-alanyl-D-glutamate endopeptidase CwlK
MDDISTTRLAAACPEFRRRATLMTEQLEDEGVPIRWTCVIRTPADQDVDYAKGRTTPGPRVTGARAYESNHQYGWAGDCVPMTLPHGQPDWNEHHAAWQQIVAAGEAAGLRAGKRFIHHPDEPHFELADQPEKPTDAMRDILVNHGLAAVWVAAGVMDEPTVPVDEPVPVALLPPESVS